MAGTRPFKPVTALHWYLARLIRGHYIMTGDILTSPLNKAICHLAVVTVYTKPWPAELYGQGT